MYLEVALPRITFRCTDTFAGMTCDLDSDWDPSPKQPPTPVVDDKSLAANVEHRLRDYVVRVGFPAFLVVLGFGLFTGNQTATYMGFALVGSVSTRFVGAIDVRKIFDKQQH